MIFFFLKIYFERQSDRKERARQRERDLVCGDSFPKWSGHNQEPGLPSGSPMWKIGTRDLGQCPAAFPVHSQRAGLDTEEPALGVSTLIWDASMESHSLVCCTTAPAPVP